MEKVAIVILNWNGSEMLRKYLPSAMRRLTIRWRCSVSISLR